MPSAGKMNLIREPGVVSGMDFGCEELARDTDHRIAKTV